MTTLQTLAIRGAAWSIAGYGMSQVFRLGSNLILTRLLVPDLFGLMALMHTLIMGLELFSDVGIEPNIVQSPRGEEPVFLNTAWTLQVARGIGLWLLCIAMAWPAAKFYQQPELVLLLPVLGLLTIFHGVQSTSLATLSRKIDLATLTLMQLGTQATTLIVMVIWAYFSPSIWALIAGNLAAGLVKVLWSHRISPIVNHLSWDAKAAKELFTFGRWIFISTALTFLAQQSDRLILGRLFSLEMLGIYSIAFTLADIPSKVVQQLGSRVIFPVISRQAHLPRPELKVKILQKRWLLLLGSIILVVGLVSTGDLLIEALYDQRYAEATWMMPILALGLWPLILANTMSPTLLAIGEPRYNVFAFALKLTYMVVVLPWAFIQFGPRGAILAIAFNDLPSYAYFSYALCQEKLSTFSQDVLATLIFAIALGLAFTIRLSLGAGLPF
ncbi:oligosaccharide flippase family protein [Synechococcales cyanobacterium C]|uniref:Oligosaccharide flippase family protein n=1 Tax=Petrachloros mirabilis ULC683 TaxID=2781853 RepID=A0A8K1ZVC9_9CYAN|nr:oligosaccharide flippase family protein [Petrachloros mirabilis]NCJ05880.1 oligosaccharide flippase family protein [Petrachloros mirabilis ULC683]